MESKVSRVCLASLILAAVSCTNETENTPPQVGVQTQKLVMAPGWVSGSGWPAETLVALNSIHLRRDSQVIGNAAVIRAGSGPFLQGAYEAVVGPSVELRGDLRGDSVRIQDGAHVFGSLSYNSLLNEGTVDGARATPLALPLDIKVPAIPNFTAGTQNLTVASSTLQTKAAGSYRDIVLRAGTAATKTVLRLSGGVYAIQSLSLEAHARVECNAACELRIKGRLALDAHAYVGPAATSGLQMNAVQIIVEGANGGNGGPEATPLAADVGQHAEIKGFMFVPNGTLHLKAKSNSIGKFIAKDLDAGNDADVQDGTGVVVLPGQWVSGNRWPSETLTVLNSLDFNQRVEVQGDVAVITAAAGAVLSSGYEASLGPNTVVTGTLRADSVIARNGSRVTGALSYNNLTNNGVTAGSLASPLTLPLPITTPAFPAFTAGTTAVDLASRADRTLAPGSYGLIRLRGGTNSDKTILTLNGGTYDVADIDVGDNSRIECVAACELRVKNRVVFAADSFLGPSGASTLDVSQVRVFVEGKNGGTGQPSATPYAVVFGANSRVSAFVFAPNGTAQLRADGLLQGRLAARDVQANDSARLQAAGTVATPPQITVHPASVSAVEGRSATFTVVALGADITFQWQRNGVNIPGATAGSYTLDPVSLTDNGASYRVVVANAGGSVTSNAAILTVTGAPPVITVEPNDVAVVEGESATFSVVASGAQLGYQWRKGGVVLGGQTASSLRLTNVSLGDAGGYDVVVRNANGAVTSRTATLTVSLAPPQITVQPSDVAVIEGQPASFSVTATGDQLSYQWRKGGADLLGQTNATLTFPAVGLGDTGNYSIVVRNSGGAVMSRAAELNVIPAPPRITTQPSDLTVDQGQSATFHVTASGTGLSYQWRKGDAPLPGETGASLTLTSVTLAHAGGYDVVVSTLGGSVVSRTVVLTVIPAPPEISQQPSDLTVNEGEAATFSVTASGALLSYQWRKDGANLPERTSATLTLNPVKLTDAGNYDVIVSNPGGFVVGRAAALGVVPAPPVITAQPSDRTVNEGQNAAFSVTATGVDLRYQWRKGGSDLAGETSATLSLTAVTPDAAGRYDVVVSNPGGAVESRAAVLTVIPAPPRIVQQPADATANEGQSASFTVEAAGTQLRYQWRKNGADIAAATDATLTLQAVTLDDADEYDVVVSNPGGSITSRVALLMVIPKPPVILEQPSDATVNERHTASFHVEASGVQLAYQWRKRGADLEGQTSATLTLTEATLDDASEYDVVVSNPGGSVVSRTAVLQVIAASPIIEEHPRDVTANQGQSVSLSVIATVTSRAAIVIVIPAPPAIATQPSDVTVNEGQSASFTVAATGVQLSYKWRRSGVNLPGQTDAALTISPASLDDEGEYDVVVTNPGGSVTSRTASLAVIPAPPQISQQPSDLTVREGQTAVFSVSATGAQRSYQWRKGGAVLAGRTEDTLTLQSASLADAGNYDVVVSNPGGNVVSRTAVLHVIPAPPVITTEPSDLTVDEDRTASFEVSATGVDLQYQWRRAGQNLSGATAARLTLDAVTVAHAGAYDVVVSNPGGSVTSRAAVLTVIPRKPVITAQPSDVSANEGSTATFSVTALGTDVRYQWRKDGDPVQALTIRP